MTESPLVGYGGHRYCDCGTPEPVRVCGCDRAYGAPLEEGTCSRCIFWRGHLNGDHRNWFDLKTEYGL